MTGVFLAAALAQASSPPVCHGEPLDAAVARYAAAVEATDPAALGAFFGADGALVAGPQQTLVGDAAIRAFLAKFSDYKVSRELMTPSEYARVKHGWRVGGRFDQTGTTPQGETFHAHGGFAMQWHCARSGWRIARLETTPDT